ncbi:MAG: hypothetical protein VX560_02595, partial [SAR324 cluster bacterium]|nr:hypothetical protein [SAR324 cluster bacterium]
MVEMQMGKRGMAGENHWISSIMRNSRPKDKFSNLEGDIDYEQHIAEFELAAEQATATDEIRLSEMGHWFNGLAGQTIKPYLLRPDHGAALKEARVALDKRFSRRRETAEQMLRSILNGQAINVKQPVEIFSFIERLKAVYNIAVKSKRKAEFERNNVIREIITKKRPNLTPIGLKFHSKNFIKTGKDLTFVEFLDFLELQGQIKQEEQDYGFEPSFLSSPAPGIFNDSRQPRAARHKSRRSGNTVDLKNVSTHIDGAGKGGKPGGVGPKNEGTMKKAIGEQDQNAKPQANQPSQRQNGCVFCCLTHPIVICPIFR